LYIDDDTILAGGSVGGKAFVWKWDIDGENINPVVIHTQGNNSEVNGMAYHEAIDQLIVVGFVTGNKTDNKFNGGTNFISSYAGKNAFIASFSVNSNYYNTASRSVINGLGDSELYSVLVIGNIYIACGYITGTSSFRLSTMGDNFAGVCSGKNAMVVRYVFTSPSGYLINGYGRSTTTASGDSVFYDVTNVSNNIYCAGSIYGNANYDFGSGTAFATPFAGGTNAAIIKLDSSLNYQGKYLPSSSSGPTELRSITADQWDNFAAAGSLSGQNSVTFGTVTLTGTGTGDNALLVYYKSNFTPLDGLIPSVNSTTGYLSKYNSVSYNTYNDTFEFTGYFKNTVRIGYNRSVRYYNQPVEITGTGTDYNALITVVK